MDASMAVLRLQIDQEGRQRTIRQLLEGARVRLEQEEHPLALQKIQEVLQIDPENSGALRMKREIEGHRSERQIDNWVRLAQEHLDRGAFSEARHGLQEALKLNSDNSKVNRMLADLTLQEQETSAARTRKEKLYNSAKEAFQNGELSTALSSLQRVLELNRRTPDLTSPEKDALYQSLYNQVHSEHDASLSAYDQARRHLTEKDFNKALEICEEYQSKYPGQALFQALRLEIGEQQRQELSSYTAEVGRRLDLEPDLDRKLNVIKDAAGRYPHEPQFQQSLKLIHERRELVLSIVAKARNYEERGQFAEAIGQWDILRSIHPQYPALSFEIEQLQRRREEQNEEEEKSRLVEQIDRSLEVGDYARARTLAQSGLAQYAGDAELAELERLADQGSERNQQAQALLEEGRQLCDSGKLEQGIDTLRRAKELDSRNTGVRSALATALTERAQALLKNDSEGADALIQQALEVDPNHQAAMSLRFSVQDSRRKEAVRACLAEARELQGKGQIQDAITSVEHALQSFPNEARLLQLRATLLNSLEPESHKQSASPTRTIFLDSGLTEAPRDRVALPVDPAAETVAWAAAPVAPRAVVAEPVIPPTPAEKFKIAPVMPVVPAPPTLKEPPVTPVLPPSKVSKPRRSRLQIGALAAVPLLIAGGWAVTHFTSRPATVANPVDVNRPTFPIEIQATPRGALIKIDGNPMIGAPANLTEGPHTIEASLPGYATASQKITAGANSQPVRFSLAPEPQRLRLNTSLSAGKILLDGVEAGELHGGMISKDDVGPGEHTLQVMDGRRELLALRFKSAIATAAEILPPLKTQDLLVVSSFGDRAKVYSGPTAFRFALKDQTPQQVPMEGLNLVTSRSGNELIASDGKTQHAMPIESGNAPTLGIYLTDAADSRPILLIASNVEGAQVILNGKVQNWSLYKGRFAGRVEPGNYTVKISKPGYAETPEQTVKVDKGDTKTLQFALTAVATKSPLVIDGGTPGAEVWIDQTSRGRLDGSGHLSIDVPAGPHDIRLSKELHEPVELGKRTAAAGQELKITAAEAKLKPFGTLNFQIGTPGAEITYKRDDETQSHTAKNDESVPVKEGRYQISISAAKFESREEHVTVTAGKPTTVAGPLLAKGDGKPDAAARHEQTLFATPGAWEQDENGYWVIRNGYGWMASANGTFQVELLRKARKLFGGTSEWMIGYRNKGKDKVLYKLNSDGALTRAVTVEGKTTEVKLPQRLTAGDSFHLQIIIEPTRIVIQDAGKGKVDEYTNPDADFTAGNFGFNKGVHLKIKR